MKMNTERELLKKANNFLQFFDMSRANEIIELSNNIKKVLEEPEKKPITDDHLFSLIKDIDSKYLSFVNGFEVGYRSCEQNNGITK
jgi:hypothetical protein